jgi:galactofuranose transport system substrate-binding protein
MRNWTRIFLVLAIIVLVLSVGLVSAASKKIVVGYAQIGAESEWRTANSRSVQQSAKDADIELIFVDAQQKQENQIKALRTFITQQVDVIFLAPVVESGWGPVLREVKEAGIPLVLVDRNVDEKDTSLWVAHMGADFVKEGNKAAKWLGDYLKAKKIDNGKKVINIVELQGTVGSAPAIDRKSGFESVMKAEHPNWKITRSQTGNFTRAEGKAVMEAFLKADKKIQVLYAHNDDMALGAIQAIEEAGLKPAKDIIIVSVDAVKGAFQAMIDGKLNCTVECSPLLGPQMMQAAEDIVAGKTLPREIWTIEGVFDMSVAAKEFPNRQY